MVDKPRQNVTAKQARLIDLLLGGQTLSAACAAVGISRMTAYRWLRQPSVKNALQEAQGELLAQSMRRLLALQAAAIDALAALLDDPLTPPAVRLATAKAVLEAALRLYDALVLEQRISALEEVVRELTGKPI